MTSDRAITGYQYAFETKADGKPDWEDIKGSKGAKVIDADPGEHTFMLRALGTSDNDTSTTGKIPGVADSKMVTVPMPSPTLPEIAMRSSSRCSSWAAVRICSEAGSLAA